MSTAIDGVATTYDYDSYHRPVKETRGGTSVAYTYDNYNRIETEVRKVDDDTMQFGYSYNSQGLLQSTFYPGNVTVGYAYDGYGNLSSVTAGNTKVWEFASNNGLRYTATLGGTLTSVEERNSQGLLTSQQMLKGSTLLHNMGYTFNASTGNLTSRSGMLSQTETFGYDNVDRLVSIQHGSTTAMALTYGANGNITSKTGIGTYSYGTKPHAVTNVTNSGSLIDTDSQSITYTAFDKAASITQNGYQLDITYGTDLQRWKSVLKNNGTVTRTTLYAGDYEKVTENGVTKQYYYIHGGNGLAALYVKQSNASDKVYYPCTDHLGSIMKMVDANGTESFKATYDAWGQQTVTTNTLNFHRGYTGHEHLSQFALINMNGRMYDPLLGRFLSPDPFVQLPDFSQNFNRYSYCLNNPLVYVDPDGEFIWAYVGIAAGVSAIMNVSANFEQIIAAGGGWKSVWKGVQYAAVGAAAGATAAIVGPAVASSISVGGVLGGAITGLFTGSASGFVNGGGNALVNGGGWDSFWKGATNSAVTGGLSGATFGGFVSGVDAFNNGTNVWTGKEIAAGRSAFYLKNTPILEENQPRIKLQKMPEFEAPDFSIKNNKIHEMAERLKPGLQTPGPKQEFRVHIVEGNYKLDFRIETHNQVQNVFKDMKLNPQDYVRHANIQLYKWIDGRWKEIRIPGTNSKNFHLFLEKIDQYKLNQ